MTSPTANASDPEQGRPSVLLELAINNLSLGLIIFNNKQEVVFCNKCYIADA